jgi:hypothetical protein
MLALTLTLILAQTLTLNRTLTLTLSLNLNLILNLWHSANALCVLLIHVRPRWYFHHVPEMVVTKTRKDEDKDFFRPVLLEREVQDSF